MFEALVVSCNAKELIFPLLNDVRREIGGVVGARVFVDNTSADGSPDAIAAVYPDIQLRQLKMRTPVSVLP